MLLLIWKNRKNKNKIFPLKRFWQKQDRLICPTIFVTFLYIISLPRVSKFVLIPSSAAFPTISVLKQSREQRCKLNQKYTRRALSKKSWQRKKYNSNMSKRWRGQKVVLTRALPSISDINAHFWICPIVQPLTILAVFSFRFLPRTSKFWLMPSTAALPMVSV